MIKFQKGNYDGDYVVSINFIFFSVHFCLVVHVQSHLTFIPDAELLFYFCKAHPWFSAILNRWYVNPVGKHLRMSRELNTDKFEVIEQVMEDRNFY